MASAATIRNKAAKKLGLLGTGQTLQSAISADLDAAYTEVRAELEELGIMLWGAADAVPDALVGPMVSLVAGARVNEYSVPNDRYQRVMADAVQAEGRIRAIISQARTGDTKVEQY